MNCGRNIFEFAKSWLVYGDVNDFEVLKSLFVFVREKLNKSLH